MHTTCNFVRLSFQQVTFSEDSSDVSNRISDQGALQPLSTGGGRQLVPGLILMPDGSALHGYHQSVSQQPQQSGRSFNSIF